MVKNWRFTFIKKSLMEGFQGLKKYPLTLTHSFYFVCGLIETYIALNSLYPLMETTHLYVAWICCGVMLVSLVCVMGFLRFGTSRLRPSMVLIGTWQGIIFINLVLIPLFLFFTSSLKTEFFLPLALNAYILNLITLWPIALSMVGVGAPLAYGLACFFEGHWILLHRLCVDYGLNMGILGLIFGVCVRASKHRQQDFWKRIKTLSRSSERE